MCGRYCMSLDHQDLVHWMEMHELPVDKVVNEVQRSSRYNIGPTTTNPVYFQIVESSCHKGMLEYMKWGFLKGYSTFNAKWETLSTSQLWKSSINQLRCVVPIQGYYEWKDKIPYYVSHKTENVFFLAGIYSKNRCYAIVTKDADSKELANLHKRMPLMLEKEDISSWLDPKIPFTHLEIKPFDSNHLNIYRVSTRVGNVKNEGSDLINKVRDITYFTKKIAMSANGSQSSSFKRSAPESITEEEPDKKMKK
ncbi:hypothetical protein PP7435_CHR1-0834 [Komagataella phaffii CBS 7435]|uniref:Abasic site processing protein n=1 Tax=Komagataella phaffii (strain ATCC 76273 / CBS 7435 / CECT 11047 / NRRL Y-11430 / Wegner 21-1) TaxID=981350 RepID=F2QN17_KOMPC|nr:GQ67_02127T0 [Komagataella phaffii]AOA66674.1 GQ68_02142T0 [Komagataella phaffii GS115]CAH2446702.1 hypothetical protein BQ9382_C1-4380 [Komagataella phaffii CBS 7435]CCA36972.1 hypothetical protein PP7435_CHR1-0834 [Komagataella phaffii CBS 7435]